MKGWVNVGARKSQSDSTAIMPDEIFISIFAYLTPLDLHNASFINHLWSR